HAELALVDHEEHRAEQRQRDERRGDDKSDPVHYAFSRFQRVSRSRVRELSRVRESVVMPAGADVEAAPPGAVAAGSVAAPPCATCCMILSSGRYSRLEPW